MLHSFIATLFAVSTLAQDPYSNIRDLNGHSLASYSPVRAPALPLAVRSPYTSAWTTTNSGSLNSNGVIFWNGDALGWDGIIVVDGISYEYLGNGAQKLPTLPSLKTAIPVTTSYDSQYSNFTLAAGPVQVTASFLSPVVPKDLCRTSIPLSYLETSFVSTDGEAHDVQLYADVNADWIAAETNKTVLWDLYRDGSRINGSIDPSEDGVYTWIAELEQQYLFSEVNDHPHWGKLAWSSSPGRSKSFSYESGFSTDIRFNFVLKNELTNTVDPNFRGKEYREPVFAFSHDFGRTNSGSAVYSVGTAQEPIMRYITSAGLQALQPWWKNCYGDLFSMATFHYKDYKTSQGLAAAFESQLKTDVLAYYSDNMAVIYSNSTPQPPPRYSNGTNGYTSGHDQYGNGYIFDPSNSYGFLDPNNLTGIAIPDVDEPQAYYAIVALSARQAMGGYVLTAQPNATCTKNPSSPSEPLMFQKEISSNGNINTVDVMYPAMPFFLYANPDLLRYNLDPLFQYQESGFYPNGYSMHDLGARFPNATGHVEGNDEYMPVEESGNMVLMSYAYYKFTHNTDFLTKHYPLLRQFAQYLIDFSLVPNLQLSTDDFAGRLTNQTNLAIKGIIGLQAMSEISRIVGEASDAATFASTAADYFAKWQTYAIDPSKRHALLAYQWRSSFGLLYNIYPAKLLSLSIIPDHIYSMQSSWYPTISQIFGIPLDNRHSYTKSDWELWTAATCEPETRRLFVNAIAYWLNTTTTNKAFTDLYDVIDGGGYPSNPDRIEFVARPVVGGHYSLLALLRAGIHAVGGNGTENGTRGYRRAKLQPKVLAVS